MAFTDQSNQYVGPAGSTTGAPMIDNAINTFDALFNNGSVPGANFQRSNFSDKNLDAMAAANPYLKSYKNRTWWDNLVNAFGFESSYDKYEAQRKQAAAEYDAQIAQLQYENQYNSPLEQSARDTAAGINPDLAGNVSSGEAAPFDQTQTSPEMPSSGFESPDHFMSFVGSIVNTAFSLYGQYQSIQGSVLNNEGKAISNASGLVNGAESIALSTLSSLPITQWDGPDAVPMVDGKPSSWDSISKSIAKSVGNQFNPYSNKRLARLYEDVVRRVVRTPEFRSKYYENYNKYAKNKTEFEISASDPAFTPNNDDIINALNPVAVEMGKTFRQLKQLELRAASKQAVYQADYFNDKDGSLQATAENAQNQNAKDYADTFDATAQAEAENQGVAAQKASKEMKRIMNQSLNRIAKSLEAQSKKGNKWASLALVALSLGQYVTLPSMTFKAGNHYVTNNENTRVTNY